ncbi:MAG: DRTGG domain-containing protein [Candidatus Muiribacteriota bacterium]|jgi:predicted transcriptional regulator
MKIDELKKILNAEVLTKGIDDNHEIENFCCTELMSDVLAFTNDGESTALITALSNAQTLRTADMVDIRVVVIVRGKQVEEKLIEIAEESGITLLRTKYPIFTVAGKLYQHINMESASEHK